MAAFLVWHLPRNVAADQKLLRTKRDNWNWKQMQKALNQEAKESLEKIQEQWHRQLADSMAKAQDGTYDSRSNAANDAVGEAGEISYDDLDVIMRIQQLSQDKAHIRALQKEGEMSSPEIPKIVHHVYKTDISNGPWPNLIWKASFESWKKHFPEPEFQHIFWSDEKTNRFFEKNCTQFSNMYNNVPGNQSVIVRSDWSRYCILSKLGGIYADLDYEVRQPFYKTLKPGLVNLVGSPYTSETVQNSLMASPAGHWYWKFVLKVAAQTMQQTASFISAASAHLHKKVRSIDSALKVSGPQLLSNIDATNDPRTVYILPCNSFQPAVHTLFGEELASRQKHCRVLKPADREDATIKGIHWGTVTWGSGSGETIRQFEDFHDVRLPGSLVRRVYHSVYDDPAFDPEWCAPCRERQMHKKMDRSRWYLDSGQ